MTIGDSSASCALGRAEPNWPARLGTLLGRSVYSLGKGDAGPYDHLQILLDFGLARHPDIVIMNIYEGDDLRDAVLYWDYVRAAKQGRRLFGRADDRHLIPDYGRWLANPVGRHSYAWNLLVTGLHRTFRGLGQSVLLAAGRLPRPPDLRYSLAFSSRDMPFNTENRDEGEVAYARLLRAGTVGTSVFDAALERLVALAGERRFQAVVALSPSAYSAYAAYVHFDDPALAPLLRHYHAALESYFAGKAKLLGFIFVDLTPDLQRAAAELQADRLLYDPITVRYTSEGERVVARSLAQALQPALADH